MKSGRVTCVDLKTTSTGYRGGIEKTPNKKPIKTNQNPSKHTKTRIKILRIV
jgi:hypothetical protein